MYIYLQSAPPEGRYRDKPGRRQNSRKQRRVDVKSQILLFICNILNILPINSLSSRLFHKRYLPLLSRTLHFILQTTLLSAHPPLFHLCYFEIILKAQTETCRWSFTAACSSLGSSSVGWKLSASSNMLNRVLPGSRSDFTFGVRHDEKLGALEQSS